MAIESLTSIVVPPANPFETEDAEILQRHQERLNLQLPHDIREFGAVYGSGLVYVQTFYIEVFNPLSIKYYDRFMLFANLLSERKEDEGHVRFPYQVYPNSPGLAPWASDVNGNILCWLTEGSPNNWRVVVRPEDGDFEEFPGPLTEFLASAFRCSIKVGIWPDFPLVDPKKIVFEPIPVSSEPAEPPMNRYELYVKNGNRAEFWVHDMRA